MSLDHSKNNLYDKDFVAWTIIQADLLKKHKWDGIDFEHLAEEIADLGKKHKRELYKRLIKLMSHLLKMEFQPENRCKSWKSTIHEQREEIKYLIKENPSLKNLISEYWAECYALAIEDANFDIGEYVVEFPKKCPWSEKEVLETLFKE